MRITAALVILAFSTTPVFAQQPLAVDPARADAALSSRRFPPHLPTGNRGWYRMKLMRERSAHRNSPPKAVAEAIRQRETATIVYPATARWSATGKKGEAIAQSGYGVCASPTIRRDPRTAAIATPATSSPGRR